MRDDLTFDFIMFLVLWGFVVSSPSGCATRFYFGEENTDFDVFSQPLMTLSH